MKQHIRSFYKDTIATLDSRYNWHISESAATTYPGPKANRQNQTTDLKCPVYRFLFHYIPPTHLNESKSDSENKAQHKLQIPRPLLQ